MSHTSHPYAVRLGIIRPWKSRWFNLRAYPEILREDVMLREFLKEKLRGMFIDSVEIERSPAAINVILRTARPGLLIGRGGEGIDKLKKEVDLYLQGLRKKTKLIPGFTKSAGNKASLKITVEEVKSPDQHAQIVAESISQSLEKRLSFRRVMKQAMSKVMASREVKGAKIALSGRLDGAEMARYEWLREGRVPLQTLRADVDFAKGRAHLPYGDLGIKVWIYKGEIFDKQVKRDK